MGLFIYVVCVIPLICYYLYVLVIRLDGDGLAQIVGIVVQLILLAVNVYVCLLTTKRRNEDKALLKEMQKLDAEQKQFWDDLKNKRGLK